MKRQKLKVEHDQMQERLHQLISNLTAEERACERTSVQVREGMEQRKRMMAMWTGAVENLRQRDSDIRHVRQDYFLLEQDCAKLAEQCREQQAFCQQQIDNNAEAEREKQESMQQLTRMRLEHRQVTEMNATLHSESLSLSRELSNLRLSVERLHMENRQLMNTQRKHDAALENLAIKLKDLKQSLAESEDKTKSSDKRAKQLEQLLNDEEQFANQMTRNQQRAHHCSFVEQQKLLALKNEEKLVYMQVKSSKAVMNKLDTKQVDVEYQLQIQKGNIYKICFQLETLGVRVCQMEGGEGDRLCSAELMIRENRLKDVQSRHLARVSLLERHLAKLHDDMRRLTRDLELKGAEHIEMKNRLKAALLEVDGGEKETRKMRTEWRESRVEEALMRLRAEHAARALAGFGRAAHQTDARRMQIDAAMGERLVEIAARKDMFGLQKRALFADCGRLRGEIREREQRIAQLIKRYDILIASLGKDDSGQMVSATFFKIKFAAERAEMRAYGASLDAQINKLERDIRALEHALRVLHAAHQHFLKHISPLPVDTPEIQELNELTKTYYMSRDSLKILIAEVAALEERVADVSSQLTLLSNKYKQLTDREAECKNELETAAEKVQRQQDRLQNANDVVKHNAKRAKRIIEGEDDWRIFQLSLWARDYWEAWQNALYALGSACTPHSEAYARAAVLLNAGPEAPDRRKQSLIQRFISDASELSKKMDALDLDESVFSPSPEPSSRSDSVGSVFTRRLAGFRKTLATRVNEKALLHDEDSEDAKDKRQSLAMRVVTLGFDPANPKFVCSQKNPY